MKLGPSCLLLIFLFTATASGTAAVKDVQKRFMLQPGVTMVGFTYGQTSHIDVSDGTILTFDKAITTVGSKGQLTGGQYVCYTSGVYKFQMYALTQNDTEVWLEMYKNNDIVVSAYSHSTQDHSDTGNAAVLELAVGDTVYVKTRDQFNVSLFGAPDEIYSTFTGVFLGTSFQNPIGSVPAFSAAIDKHLFVTGGNNVAYNKVITDVANIYDNTTGVVTVKSAGLYIIHFFSLSRQGAEIYLQLYHNSNFVCALYNYAENEWTHAGNTAILHLNVGDTVKVRAATGYDNSIYGGPDELYSSFSGALIATEAQVAKNDNKATAFTAGLSKDQTTIGGQKVVFDQIILNTNRGYDATTGVFTAPIGGDYEFIFHALGQVDEPIWLELYHNYQYIDSLYSHNPGHYASGGNAAVLHLNTGDTVYVQATDGNDNLLYGRGDEIYCTFSGYLIRSAPTSG